ncbi:MAG: hypothetical protein QNK37_34380 [Acidobacteriota bacterium]|nr:hypothetical protein [Acidobacteriota bacterium]
MPQYKTSLEPELERKIERIRRGFEAHRRKRLAMHFGMVTVGLVLVTTALLYNLDAPLLRNLALFGFLVAWIYAAWRTMFKPMRQPVSREQVALYIDERFPELQDRMVSMVSVSSPDHEDQANVLSELFLAEAQAAVNHSAFAYHYTLGTPIKGGWRALGLFALAFAVIMWFGDLWRPSADFTWEIREALFTVEPGDARVREGDEQVIFVRSKITGKAVAVRWRNPGKEWEVEPMKPGDSRNVHYYRFRNITADIEYQVKFGANQSPVYRLQTWMPPEVASIDLTYHYPDYLRLPPRDLPNSGDIDAIQGTTVSFRVQVNKPLEKVSLVMESGTVTELTRDGPNTWVGNLEITRDDSYHVELADENGDGSIYNPTYSITAREDTAPEIKIDFPYRDMEINALAEVDFTFKVTDDFGLESYGIRYQVAGRDAVDIALKPEKGYANVAEGNHRLMLEDMNLSAGDLVTWTVWAKDQKPDRADYEIVGDPFFLEIRPFQRRFQEAVSNQQGGGAPGGGQDLIATQKKIIIATWNLRRKLGALEMPEYEKSLNDIIDTQRGLKEKLQQAAAMGGGDSQLIGEAMSHMDEALEALGDADWPEPEAQLAAATEAEQKAYRLLLKMEPPQSQVARNQNQGGGSGSQRNMAGMRELELKRNRNFYEDEKRTRQEQQAAAETLDKIRDLAQRQKMVNDEIARLVSEMSGSEDPEEIKRRLERLREEARKAIEELDRIQSEASAGNMDRQAAEQVRDQLDQAREQMNRGLENMRPESLQQARAAGTRAVSELDELEKELEEQTSGSARERVKELQEKLAQLQNLQENIQDRVQELGKEKDSPRLTGTDPNQKNKNELLQEKDRLREELMDLMEDAAETANLARSGQELISRKLGDWLRQTSKKGVVEDIEETSNLLKNGVWEDLPEKEARIAEKLDEALEDLRGVAGEMVNDELEARTRALSHLEELEKKLSENAKEGLASGPGDRKEQRPGEGKEDGEEKGRGPGEEKSEERQASNERGEQPGEKREDRNGRGEQPGERQAMTSERQQGEGGRGETDANGRNARQRESIPGYGGGSDRSPQRRRMSQEELLEMQRFAETDYKEWLDRLETAEQLLPARSPIRRDIAGIRREIEKMRRNYRREHLVPQWDLYIQAVARPLVETAEALSQDIEERKEERRFILRDDGGVPDQYRKNVSEYFRALSDSEGG